MFQTLIKCSGKVRDKLKRFKVSPERPVPDNIPKPVWYNGKLKAAKQPPEIHDKQVQFSANLVACALMHLANPVQAANHSLFFCRARRRCERQES